MPASALELPRTQLTVDPAWIDLYGHMNAARYVGVFDHTGYQLLDALGVGESYTRTSRCGIYTVDIAVNYRRELLVGDPLELRLRVLGADTKRLLCLMELFQTRDNYLAATMEQLSVHVNLDTRRSQPFPDTLVQSLQAAAQAHASAPLPERHVRRLALARTA
ncbi:thioesterase family protein [Bordetella sp. BOR01]|uniref:thioesterase family protein n=1 Tax=Bordetella sp. BOR01 TaxID=2854779 RepID=UPI001C4527D1|nr:thioesterase family protein [Bordetella sp. BOR01]MBV7485116.1 thioesterase family protein [Bordetella sp. BOR01]